MKLKARGKLKKTLETQIAANLKASLDQGGALSMAARTWSGRSTTCQTVRAACSAGKRSSQQIGSSRTCRRSGLAEPWWRRWSSAARSPIDPFFPKRR